MMTHLKTLCIFALGLIFLVRCEEDAISPLGVGRYSGEFTVFYQYNTDEETTSSGPTTLTIDENGYNLTETTYVTPPRSAGRCQWNESSISFEDTIIHTAEFDWQLIIHGAYVYSFDGTTLDMSQYDSDGKRKYRYILRKD